MFLLQQLYNYFICSWKPQDKRSTIVSTFLCLIVEGNSATGAIAGVVVGVALLFVAPAIVFAWWRQRKPQEFFFDVPDELSHPIQLNTVLVE